MIRLEMKNYNYNYEYLTGKEILPSNQQQIIEQAKFTYSTSSSFVSSKLCNSLVEFFQTLVIL